MLLLRNDPKFLGRQFLANSIDPDQTNPPGAVWLGSALFATLCVVWMHYSYGKTIYHKRTMWLSHGVMHPEYADGLANSVDPDQTLL